MNLIAPGQQQYEGGISILPIFMAKGLEFDAVIIIDTDEVNYEASPQDAKLLYVAAPEPAYTGALARRLPFPVDRCDPRRFHFPFRTIRNIAAGLYMFESSGSDKMRTQIDHYVNRERINAVPLFRIVKVKSLGYSLGYKSCK